jgi:hypothetical protein
VRAAPPALVLDGSPSPRKARPKKSAIASPSFTRIGEGWEPGESVLATLSKKRIGRNVALAGVADFVTYWQNVKGERGEKVDWNGTFRVWMVRSQKDGKLPDPLLPSEMADWNGKREPSGDLDEREVPGQAEQVEAMLATVGRIR